MNSPLTISPDPNHLIAQYRQAIDAFSLIANGMFSSENPSSDEILHVASQLSLTPSHWDALAAELKVDRLAPLTRGLVLGFLFTFAQDQPKRTVLRSVPASEKPFKVRYYDAAASRRGRGVQIAVFDDHGEATSFAVGKTLHSKPAVVEANA